MGIILILIAIWLIYGVIKSYFKVRALKRRAFLRQHHEELFGTKR